MQLINVGIYGASGYTGYELFKLLRHHQNAKIKFITSESQAGNKLSQSWVNAPNMNFVSTNQTDLQSVDCVFLCLPHTKSAAMAKQALDAGVRVIDLSADLRIKDPAVYQQWYAVPHPQPELLPAPYGLPELWRDNLHSARAIANPGCYATAALLGITPLARAGQLIESTPVIVDAKSGTTGAGRKPKQNTLFSEVHGNFSPYNTGRGHRHIGEIEQQLALDDFQRGRLIFTPHLLPTDRGILAAIYAQVKDSSMAANAVQRQYEREPLVRVLPQGELASLANVVRTPWAVLSLDEVNDNLLIVMVAIDNLLKGASSQAVQNFNLMYELPETTGLRIWEPTV